MASPTTKLLGSFETPPIDTTHNTNGNSSNNIIGSQDLSNLATSTTTTKASYLKAAQTSRSFPRTEISLINPSGKPMTLKTGTIPNSVFYALPVTQKALELDFLLALRQHFPLETGFGLMITDSISHRVFELGLPSAADCIAALKTPIVIAHGEQSYTFPAFPAVSSDQGLIKVNFSELKVMSYATLKDRITMTFSEFGIVRDIVLYQDDLSGTWFTGNGYVQLERHAQSELPSLRHRITLAGGTESSFLATWSEMGKYCRFCKELGHRKDSCTKRPVDNRHCFTCGKKGHISLRCPREAVLDSSDIPGSKRTRMSNKLNRSNFTHGPTGSKASIHAPANQVAEQTGSVPTGVNPPNVIPPTTTTENTLSQAEEVEEFQNAESDAVMPDAPAGNYNLKNISTNNDFHPLPPASNNSSNSSLGKSKTRSSPAAPYRASDRHNKGSGPDRLNL